MVKRRLVLDVHFAKTRRWSLRFVERLCREGAIVGARFSRVKGGWLIPSPARFR
jgi:hypothetical protein